MSTVDLTSPRTRLRLTARGRRVLATLVGAPVAAGLAFSLLSGGAALASRDVGAADGSFTAVTVRAGETLWGIAERVAPTADPRDVIDAIERLNQVEAGALIAGERISLPREYAAP